jgi:predicted enzyme related to lactoylglutathione lyase
VTHFNDLEFPAPDEGFVITNFIVAEDVERTAQFYTNVLGGKVVLAGGQGAPTIVKLANAWVTINVGGGPTPDKPDVTLEPPKNPDRVNAFMNLRVADIAAVYAEWSERGAEFLTEPVTYAWEIRCYMKDPDGRIIEVGQSLH